MLLVPTFLAPSRIHGLGVHATEPIAKGTPVWCFDPLFDRIIPPEVLDRYAPHVRRFLETYAYAGKGAGGLLFLDGDNGRFMNHSDQPNTDNSESPSLAQRDIARGEEITCDYREFVEDFEAGHLAGT